MLVLYVLAGLLMCWLACLPLARIQHEEAPMFVSGAPIGVAVLAFMYGAGTWLLSGQWEVVSFREFLGLFGVPAWVVDEEVRLIGLNKISRWIAELNVGWVGLGLGFFLTASMLYWSSFWSDLRGKTKP